MTHSNPIPNTKGEFEGGKSLAQTLDGDMYVAMLGQRSGEALFNGLFNNPDLGDSPVLKNALANLAGNAVYKVGESFDYFGSLFGTS